MLCLVIESAGSRRTVPLKEGQLTVGSSPTNDVVLDSEYVSRRHALIRVATGGIEIEDLGSRNGVVVNGARLASGRVEPPCVIEFAPDARATLLTADTDEILLFPVAESSRPGTSSRPGSIPAESPAVEQATQPGGSAPRSMVAQAAPSLERELLRALAAADARDPWSVLLEHVDRSLGFERCLILLIGRPPMFPNTVLAARGALDGDADLGTLADLRHALVAAGGEGDGRREGEAEGTSDGELSPASHGTHEARERRTWFASAALPTEWIAFWGEASNGDDLSRAMSAVSVALHVAARLAGSGSPAPPAERAPRRAFRLEAPDRVVVECRSSIVRELHERMAGATTSDLNVLLVGGTGVGKEIYARSLHQQSARRGRPFRAVNSGSFPEALLESLLFGAEDGVATGVRRQKGLLREADGGTFFLDEIGEMSPAMQSKLLRAIEERAVLPLGGAVPLPVDVRFVAATNRDLRAEIQAGRFREDLYQRLRGHEYRVPSLAEHAEDIPAYVNAFLRDEARKAGRRIPGVTVKAMKCLMEHSWPGNVRELETTMRRLVHELPEDGRPIGHADLPAELAGLAPARAADLEDRLDATRRRIVLETLLACDWNRSEAARRLGIGRGRLRELLRRLEIEDPRGPESAEG